MPTLWRALKVKTRSLYLCGGEGGAGEGIQEGADVVRAVSQEDYLGSSNLNRRFRAKVAEVKVRKEDITVAKTWNDEGFDENFDCLDRKEKDWILELLCRKKWKDVERVWIRGSKQRTGSKMTSKLWFVLYDWEDIINGEGEKGRRKGLRGKKSRAQFWKCWV